MKNIKTTINGSNIEIELKFDHMYGNVYMVDLEVNQSCHVTGVKAPGTIDWVKKELGSFSGIVLKACAYNGDGKGKARERVFKRLGFIQLNEDWWILKK